MRNRISMELGVGCSYSDKLKNNIRRLTYINTGVHVDEAKRLLEEVSNVIKIEESWVDGQGLYFDRQFFSSGRHYLRVYIQEN